MPRKRIETGIKVCQTCGNEFFRHSSEAVTLFQKRLFCCKACVRRKLKPDSEITGRYRQTKVNGKRVFVHRAVAERIYGRYLLPGEIVHHKDGNSLNNDPVNLEIVSAHRHSIIHNQKHAETYLCAICGKPFAPHKTKRGIKKHCSRECFREYQKRSHGHYVSALAVPL